MRIILVRHGETVANRKRIHQSHTSGKLSPEGIRQARLVGDRLRKENIDIIYCSDLGRTRETLSYIQKHLPHVKVVFEPRLRERSQGIYDGKPYGTFDAAAKVAGVRLDDFKPAGAESLEDLEKRVFAFFDEILKHDKSHTVLIVTHAGPIRQILKRVTHNPDHDPRNTAVSIIEVENRRLMPILINDTHHLQGTGPSRVILVRHGEVIENVRGINCGQSPGRLTKKGLEQAERLALRLRKEPIDAIYSSDLSRAAKTARIIKSYHQHTPLYLVRALRECSQGVYEGTPMGSMHRAASMKSLPFACFRPRGGESIQDLKIRVKRFFSLLQEEEHGTILIVTHGGVICNLLLHLFKIPEREFRKFLTDNTSVTVLDFKGKTAHLSLFNCTKHLRS